MFGILHLLGFQFSPRLADIGGTRFWRVDPEADYDALDGLARHRAKMPHVVQNWDDMLRLAGSFKLGTVQAAGLIRTLQTNDRPADGQSRAHPRRTALVFVPGHLDGTHAPGPVPLGAAPGGGPDRLRCLPARARSGRARPLHPEPPGGDAGGAKARRSWRKLYLGLVADIGQIVAAALTGRSSTTAPRSRPRNGTATCTASPSTGRAAWQKASRYIKQTLAEVVVSRFKQVIGHGLRSRTKRRRAAEVDVAIHALNRMLDLGRPISVRIT